MNIDELCKKMEEDNKRINELSEKLKDDMKLLSFNLAVWRMKIISDNDIS